MNRPPSPFFDRRKDLAVLLLFLLLPLLAFADLVWAPNTLYRGDLTWIHYPLRLFAAEQWLSGRVPLWNPYVLSGAPLLAEAEIGVLQPLNAVFLLPIPPYRALTLFVLLHYPLAAASTYLLARLLGLGRPAAAVSGLSFGFGGFLMAQVTNLNVMTGAAWMPLVIAGFVWARQKERPAAALLAGVPLALHILAAHPQVPFYTTLLLAGWAAFDSVRLLVASRRAEVLRVWRVLALMFLTGLLLAAPQILPTWELQRHSVRSAGVSYDQVVYFSMPPVQWIALALPNVFGTSVTGYHGVAGNYDEMHVYIGILPLLLAPLSWRTRRQSTVVFLWLAAITAGLLSLGGYTPVYRWLSHLPAFNLFRAPTRWSLVVTFALSLLAGYGLETVLRRTLSPPLRLGLAGLWLAVVLALGLVWWYQAPLHRWFNSRPVNTDLVRAGRELVRRGLFEVPEEYGSKMVLGPLAFWVTPAVALVSRLGVSVLLLGLYAAGRLKRQKFTPAVLGLVALDMALAGGMAGNPVKPASHWTQVSEAGRYVIRHTRPDLARFFSTASSQEEDVVAGLKHYFPSAVHAFASGGHSSLELERFTHLRQQAHPLMWLILTGNRFVLNKGRLSADAESVLEQVYQAGEWRVYAYADPLPRAFVVRQVQVVPDEQAALAALKTVFDPRQRLILEADGGTPPSPTPPAAGQPDTVQIVSYQPDRVEIEVDLPSAGYLVLTDNAYPGWQAYVDSQRRPVYRAYVFARAVYVDAGAHRVVFVYRPGSFYGGVVAALAGLGLVLAAGWRLGIGDWLLQTNQLPNSPTNQLLSEAVR